MGVPGEEPGRQTAIAEVTVFSRLRLRIRMRSRKRLNTLMPSRSMILHAIILDDRLDNLLSLGGRLSAALEAALNGDASFREAYAAAQCPGTSDGNFRVARRAHRFPGTPFGGEPPEYQFKLHFCHIEGTDFGVVNELLETQFVAAVVSDNRLGTREEEQRAGERLTSTVQHYHPECRGVVLYSAYKIEESDLPSGVNSRRRVSEIGVDAELSWVVSMLVESFTKYLQHEPIRAFAQALAGRSFGYQSDAFGSVLRTIYHLGQSPWYKDGPQDKKPPIVFLRGETGTGKSELAHLLHTLSKRPGEIPTIIECGMLSAEPTIVRSALFGCDDGVFTGVKKQKGKVEAAGRGTLLIDDIHRMHPACCEVLHHFFDLGRYAAAGPGTAWTQAECAIVITAEEDEWGEIKSQGLFPDSTVDRIERFTIRIPPFSERSEDTPHVARQLAARQQRCLSDGALEWVTEQVGQGSARKLKAIVDQAAVLAPPGAPLDRPLLLRIWKERNSGPLTVPAPPPSPPQPELRAVADEYVRLIHFAIRRDRRKRKLPACDAAKMWADLLAGPLPRIWSELIQAEQQFQLGQGLLEPLLRILALAQRDGAVYEAAADLGVKRPTFSEYFNKLNRDCDRETS